MLDACIFKFTFHLLCKRQVDGARLDLTFVPKYKCYILQNVTYRGVNKGLFVLLSNCQARPGRTVKQEQEEISRNHVQTFISPSVSADNDILQKWHFGR